MCRRSLRCEERAATLEDFVLRTVTRLPSFPARILGIVFDLTNRYSSPFCLLFFLNVPHNMFPRSASQLSQETRLIDHRSCSYELHVYVLRAFHFENTNLDSRGNPSAKCPRNSTEQNQSRPFPVRFNYRLIRSTGVPGPRTRNERAETDTVLGFHAHTTTHTNETEYFFSPLHQHGAA